MNVYNAVLLENNVININFNSTAYIVNKILHDNKQNVNYGLLKKSVLRLH